MKFELQSSITSKKNDRKPNPRRGNKQKDIVRHGKASITRKREFVRDEKHELVPYERKGVLPAASPGIRFSQELRAVRGDRNPFPTRIARAGGATDEANESGGNGDDEKKEKEALPSGIHPVATSFAIGKQDGSLLLFVTPRSLQANLSLHRPLHLQASSLFKSIDRQREPIARAYASSEKTK